jgi:hypothetical protein
VCWRAVVCAGLQHSPGCCGVRRPPPCADCIRDGESTPAEYTCCEAKCDLKALCDVHILAHKRWGHPVSLLVPEDATGTLTPDALRGVTHCAVPEHAGAEGVLTHVCKPCGGALVCRSCVMTGHLGGGHDVLTVESAAEAATAAIATSLPLLREGLAHQVSLAAAYRQQLEVLAARRAVAVEALGVATARMHAAVDAKHAALLVNIEATYDNKVAAAQVGLAGARAAAAELATVAATAEAGLGTTASAAMRVHVARSVDQSLVVAQRRDEVDASVATLDFEGASDEELDAMTLGWIVAGTPVAAGGLPPGQVCHGAMCD